LKCDICNKVLWEKINLDPNNKKHLGVWCNDCFKDKEKEEEW